MDNCIFCNQDAFRSNTVKEFDSFYLLVNKYPFNKQDEHYVLTPKEHRPTLSLLTETEYEEYQMLFKMMDTAMQKIGDDYRWWSNRGENALQTIDHFHVHFKTFHSKDDRSMDRVELNEEEITQWINTLINAIDA